MLIKIILIVAILALAVPMMKSRVSERNTAMRRMGILVFAAIAVVSVTFPTLTSRVAHLLGVHRGTDLLLYLAILAFLASLVSAAKNRSRLDHKITKVARAQALASVISPQPQDAASPSPRSAPSSPDSTPRPGRQGI